MSQINILVENALSKIKNLKLRREYLLKLKTKFNDPSYRNLGQSTIKHITKKGIQDEQY